VYDDTRSRYHAQSVGRSRSQQLLQELKARPQSTMAIAQVVFHRFYMVSSMTSFGVNVRTVDFTGRLRLMGRIYRYRPYTSLRNSTRLLSAYET